MFVLLFNNYQKRQTMKINYLKIFVCFILIIPLISFSQKDGIDTIATINSFGSEGEFYSMDYSGDYNELLNWIDDQMTGKSPQTFDPFECSLYSANGDENYQIFGRNFDNPDNDVLLSRFSPPDGHKSMAFTRMIDLGFAYGTNFSGLSFDQKLPLLMSAYFVPDGINEHGLACGLASVDAVQVSIDPTKDTIFVTRLIREILDHAQTVEEALEVANSYNVFDNGINIISHHLLVGTPQGESLVLEYHNGAFQAEETDEDWQVVTNIPVWDIPNQQLMNDCWRYNSLYSELEENQGALTWSEGMVALENVHLNCPWSAIYDMTNKGIYVSVFNNYEDIAYVDLENFEFLLYVDVPKLPFKENKTMISNFPNPIIGSTTINYYIHDPSNVKMIIYDSHGRLVKELVNDMKQKGHYTVCWDATDTEGKKMETGLYLCNLIYRNYSESTRMVLLER